MAPAAIPRPNGPERAADLIDRLALEGRFDFTTEEAAEALGASEAAVRAALRRLKHKGAIVAPVRGFHVLVSPEHRAAGCPPPEQFVPRLMARAGAPYYVGLLSAAAWYGAATDAPGPFQVVTDKPRPEIHCGSVVVRFVARQAVALVPTREMETPRGNALVSTPEATAIDLAAYPQHAGGLDQVALLLVGLAEHVDAERLVAAAASVAEMPWVQRLGYLLDAAGSADVAEPLARFVAERAPVTTPLDPRLPWTGTPREARWRLAVNTRIGG